MPALRTPMQSDRWAGVCVRMLLVVAAHIAVIALLAQSSPELRQKIEPVFVSFVTPELPRVEPPSAPKPVLPAPRTQPKPVAKQPQAREPVPLAIESTPVAEITAERPTTPTVANPVADLALTASSAPVAVPATSKPTVAIVAPRFDAAYLNNPRPEYPRIARRLGEHGRVLLQVFVNPAGRAEKVEIRNSSGYPRLDQAARDAVQNWQFVPARQADEAVGAWVLVPITFVLEG